MTFESANKPSWDDAPEPEAVAFNRELNPSTSSITDSQANQAAAETGICSGGEQCGATNGYCEGCPNYPWGGESRMSVIGQNGNDCEHYAAEPEWIKWTGETDFCPVPHGHCVEVEFLDGSRERDSTPEEWGWHNNPKHVTDGDIVAYRDWTAFNLTNQKGSAKQCPESQEQGQVQKADYDLSSLYPKYYKDVSGHTVLDVYGVHKLFGIDDPSGCIQHASKKLLLSGVRTGGKSKTDDIREARDTLNRWLELHGQQNDTIPRLPCGMQGASIQGVSQPKGGDPLSEPVP